MNMRRSLVFHLWTAIAAISVTRTAQASASTSTSKTIAVVEFMQETNSFSPVLTTLKEFEASLLLKGESAIMEHCTTVETYGHVAGFLKAVQDHGANDIRVVPILQARCVSGGPIQRQLYEDFKTFILDGIKAIDELDAIYLSLHGAMGVEGMLDAEGDLLQGIRDVVGSDLPIGVTHDLHANLTQKRMDLMTFLVGYRTNPHRDYFSVGQKAGEILVQTCQGKIRPTMAYRKMRLLKGGGMTLDFLYPMRQIFNWMSQQERANPTVLWLSNFMVHLWLDEPELGWATVAVTNNDLALAEQLAEELADRNWESRNAPHPTGDSPAEAIAIAEEHWFSRYFGTVVFCDWSDAVGAGSPGESTWILKALLDHHNSGRGSNLTSYLTVRDAESMHLAFDGSIGETMTMNVGGKLDPLTNSPVEFTGELIHKFEDDQGKAAILRQDGIHLILNEIPDALQSPEYFTKLGLSLWEADIVVVKNLFPFRYRYLLYNRKSVNVVTPGVTNIDVHALKYTRIPRPIYPLDEIDSWHMVPTNNEPETTGESIHFDAVGEEL